GLVGASTTTASISPAARSLGPLCCIRARYAQDVAYRLQRSSPGSNGERAIHFRSRASSTASFRISASSVFLPSSRCSSRICRRAASSSVAGTTASPAPTAVSAPSFSSLRQWNNWFGFTPCRRATSETDIPGSYVARTIASFSEAVHRLRRWTAITSTSLLFGLVIDTVLCLPLRLRQNMCPEIQGATSNQEISAHPECRASARPGRSGHGNGRERHACRRFRLRQVRRSDVRARDSKHVLRSRNQDRRDAPNAERGEGNRPRVEGSAREAGSRLRRESRGRLGLADQRRVLARISHAVRKADRYGARHRHRLLQSQPTLDRRSRTTVPVVQGGMGPLGAGRLPRSEAGIEPLLRRRSGPDRSRAGGPPPGTSPHLPRSANRYRADSPGPCR